MRARAGSGHPRGGAARCAAVGGVLDLRARARVQFRVGLGRRRRLLRSLSGAPAGRQAEPVLPSQPAARWCRGAGIHRTYLGGIETARRNPSLRNIIRIAVALGVPVKELFQD
ncbi:MAG: helix-turn-helix transcriptional regulator [Bryobacteraceae bacterium]